MFFKKIIAIPPPDDNCGEDRRTCVEGNHGNFTVASVYSLLLNLNYGIEDIMWAKIWKLQTPERVKYFIWCAKHDRLLTRYRKSKMFLGPPYCMVCSDIVESALHVLRDCVRCMNLWLNIVDNSSRELFFNTNLQQWIQCNLNGRIKGIDIED
jgi:hypothetical protein